MTHNQVTQDLKKGLSQAKFKQGGGREGVETRFYDFFFACQEGFSTVINRGKWR